MKYIECSPSSEAKRIILPCCQYLMYIMPSGRMNDELERIKKTDLDLIPEFVLRD
jgi:hypothetical protein